MRTGKLDTIGILQLPIGSPEGLTLAYVSATQISVAPGRALVGAAGSRSIAILASAFTKSLSSVWAAGTGQGMRASGAGAVAANQSWHIFLIRNSSTGAIDIQADTSATGVNLTSGWSGRIIGSIMTDASSNIRSFVQTGDRFDWSVANQDFFSSQNTSTATTNLQLLTVPTGISVVAIGRVYVENAISAAFIYGGSPAVAADAIAYCTTTNKTYTPFEIPTNTSGQIRHYALVSNTTCELVTRGFYHPRGAY